MSETIIGIYGASGFGKEVYPLVREYVAINSVNSKVCFIDDDESIQSLSNIEVITYKEFYESNYAKKQVVVAIANGRIRKSIVKMLLENDIPQVEISSSNNVLMDNIQLGKGSLLCPFVTLTSNIKIGISFHANIYSYVAHDCIIGDFVTFAPRVMCNGNVHIEDHAYIGTGAILKQGTGDKPLTIGKGAIVGMGAVVTKDVAPNTVVVGNPARPLTKN